MIKSEKTVLQVIEAQGSRIAVSACLLGVNCKYDGMNSVRQSITTLCLTHTLIPLCPEQLGGLTTPRRPAEIKGHKVFTDNNIEVTDAFLRGANETLRMLQTLDIHFAILKDGSPSCGTKRIYDGTFRHRSIEGEGITAKVLRENGILLFTEEDFHNTKISNL